ncbi:MAG: hypothetical protein PHY85_04510 [Bacteroidales bacterium]|nr:hypothetical protein [Bacteroidales bacterium]
MKYIISIGILLIILSVESKAQQIIQQDGKYGIIDEKNKVIARIVYDSAYKTKFSGHQGLDNQYIIIVKNHKYGMVLTPVDTIASIIEPMFDTIIHRDYGYLLLKKGDKWGFVLTSIASHSSGFFTTNSVATSYRKVIITKIEYDDLYNPHDTRYLKKNGKYGLIYSSDNIIPCEYDTIIYQYKENVWVGSYELSPKGSDYVLAKIVKNGKFNYLSMGDNFSNKILFPYIYKDEELFYVEDGLFVINQPGKPLQLYNVIDSTYKIITDEQGKALILDKYFRFSGDEREEVDSVCLFYGESPDGKKFITIFTNVNKKENSLIFIDTDRPDYDVNFTSIFKYKYNQVIGWNDSYYGADNQIIQSTPFTAFISKISSYKVDGILMRDYSLISFPDKKVVYNKTYKSEDEYIVVNNPKPEKMECCCPYFQIVKYIKTHNRYNEEKKEILGYINYKTYEFSKKRPKGCEDDQENKLSGEMYKE